MMSVNSVSSSCAPSLPAAGAKADRASEVRALHDALQAGDLDGARTAYEALQRGKQGPNGASPLAKQAETLGAALRRGDLEKAQGIFASLVQNLKGSQATDGPQPAAAASDDSRAPKSATPATGRVDITA